MQGKENTWKEKCREKKMQIKENAGEENAGKGNARESKIQGKEMPFFFEFAFALDTNSLSE